MKMKMLTHRRRTLPSFLIAGLCLATLTTACASDDSGTSGDDGAIVCRSYADQNACAAAPDFTFDDGSYARCQWFEGEMFERSGDSCGGGASAGVCLSVGPTQMSCTYNSLDQTYPTCSGQFTMDDVPPYWVATDAGETILLSDVCGPTIVDDMAGRCGKSVDDDSPECECPCL
jgi:hypothetical protein